MISLKGMDEEGMSVDEVSLVSGCWEACEWLVAVAIEGGVGLDGSWATDTTRGPPRCSCDSPTFKLTFFSIAVP